MNEPTISNRPKVTVGGAAEIPKDLAAALGECWVDSSVNLPGAFHLTFLESAHKLMKDPECVEVLKIGTKIAVYAIADSQGKDTPLIAGVVTGVETEYDHGIATTILRGMDPSFKMMRQRRAVGYLNMTASEIVAKLAAQDGVDLGEIETTSPVYEIMTQPNISDWQFVQYLAESTGMEADFDYEGRLRFRKPVPAALGLVQIDFERDVLHCRAGVSASDQVSQVTSRGWNEDEKTLLLGKAPAVSSPEYSIGTTPGQAVAAFGTASLTETGTPYGTQPEADRAASSLAADITSAFAEMDIEMRGWPSLRPGTVVRLQNAGTMFDGDYTISATRHMFNRNNEYVTQVRVTGRQARTLYGLAAGAQPSGGQPEPRIPGVVNAIVTDINDPKQQGRVKLRFPWFDDTYVTDWVRTMQFGGYRGGGVISPEVEDEVLVAFDRGSMDHPYVIGGLYSNPQNSPSPHDTPLYTAGRLNRRSLVTRTGHRLELLDAPAEKGVRLRSGDEALTVFLDQTKTAITISSDGTVDITGKTGVRVNSDSKVSVTAPEVTITGAVTIEGDTTIRGAVNIEGSLQQTGVSNFTGEMSVKGMVTITGDENVIGIITQDSQPVMVV